MTQNKPRFPSSDMNAGSSGITQGEGMSESNVKTLEKALVPASSRQDASHLLTTLETQGVQCFKSTRYLTHLKIERNSNIPLATGKGHLVSCLTLNAIPIALPSLKENPGVSLATSQES